MKIEGLTKRQFERLQPLVLDKSITSIESNLYIIPGSTCGPKILKCYKNQEGDYFGNKLLTINALINKKEEIGIEELIFPEKLAIVNKKVVGFTMPYIDKNINLSTLLSSSMCPTEKILLLKQVQKIIEKVAYVKLDDPFFLADIHESNFVLNLRNGHVYAVDLDGCKISNNEIFTMKYGSFNEKIFDFEHKYPLDENDNPIPNKNTEWYCFMMMVLNTISSGKLHKLLLNDFYDYLEFLKSNDFPKELIDVFCNLYKSKDNNSPGDLLDEIPYNLDKITLEKFLVKTKKKDFYKSFLL